MFCSLCVVCVLAMASVNCEYQTILQEGIVGLNLQSHETYGIPNKQCSGLLSAPTEYHCHCHKNDVALLQVQVTDYTAPPEVKFNDNRTEVYIYRKRPCNGEAIVKVSWICWPDVPYGNNKHNIPIHKDNIPYRFNKDNAPYKNSKDNKPYRNRRDNMPHKNNKQNIQDRNSKDYRSDCIGCKNRVNRVSRDSPRDGDRLRAVKPIPNDGKEQHESIL